ncbi:hypothetical protein HZU77_005620 [Neisseriaceae bacterium TC5R-5]|nr:hypothetical protein [Neisseriaceae bacterium TC5R-5]
MFSPTWHGPRIEGDSRFLLDGMPVALEDHVTECGCILIVSYRRLAKRLALGLAAGNTAAQD